VQGLLAVYAKPPLQRFHSIIIGIPTFASSVMDACAGPFWQGLARCDGAYEPKPRAFSRGNFTVRRKGTFFLLQIIISTRWITSSVLEEPAQEHQRAFVGSDGLRQFPTRDLPACSFQEEVVRATPLHQAYKFRSQLFATLRCHFPLAEAHLGALSIFMESLTSCRATQGG
jgi:hypothetical protein